MLGAGAGVAVTAAALVTLGRPEAVAARPTTTLAAAATSIAGINMRRMRRSLA